MSNLPKIKYALVGYDNKILCDYYEKYGEFVSHITDVLFPKTRKKGNIFWASHHVDYLYIREEDDIIVFMMMESGFNKEVAISFLVEIRNALNERYDKKTLKHIRKFQLTDFKEELESLTSKYNTKYVDKTKLVLQEVSRTKDLFTVNLQNLLERSNELNQLTDQVNQISEDSVVLMKNSNKLLKSTRRERYKVICFFIVLALLGLYLLLSMFCGWNLKC